LLYYTEIANSPSMTWKWPPSYSIFWYWSSWGTLWKMLILQLGVTTPVPPLGSAATCPNHPWWPNAY
jgi:hypothetical protein